MIDWTALLEKLGREPIPSRLEPTEERIQAFEQHIGAILPGDYREFLSQHSGVWVSACAPIAELTPCGQFTAIQSFYGFMEKEWMSSDLQWNSDTAGGASVAIPIADGAFGSQIFLFISENEYLGIKSGAVYFWDWEGRSAWTDEKFHRMFSNLAPEIRTYLQLRKDGQLPEKHDGLEDFYRIADSFTGFLEVCTPDEDEEE